MSNINSDSWHLSFAVKGIYLPLKWWCCVSFNKQTKMSELNLLKRIIIFLHLAGSTRQNVFFLSKCVPALGSKFPVCDSHVKVFNDTVGINLYYFPIYISFLPHECLLSQSCGRLQVSQFQSLVSLFQNPSTMKRCRSSCKSQIDFL